MHSTLLSVRNNTKLFLQSHRPFKHCGFAFNHSILYSSHISEHFRLRSSRSQPTSIQSAETIQISQVDAIQLENQTIVKINC
jgi:hypothetical protein